MEMDHEVVARQKITERYLLNELDSDTRDQFEEHFFECTTCAFDVRAASALVEHSKVVLTEGLAEVPVAGPVPAKSWLGWLRPAFSMPMLVLLLTVVGYQNLVTYPRMKQALDHPHVLPWASVNIGTFGSTAPEITTATGKGFLVFVRIPPQSGYSLYKANLYNAAGKLEWSLTIPATASQDQWPITVPDAYWQPGTYTLIVRGTTTTGASEEVGQGSFELKIQN
jgi:hypothetical protein